MKRAAATSAYVRSWLPSVWKRALQRLVQFLLRLSMFPRRLLMLERSRGARADGVDDDGASGSGTKRRWLRMADTAEADTLQEGKGSAGTEDEDDNGFFFAAETAPAATSTRRGLANTGNTCFINAVVQCLLAIPGFVDRLEDEMQRVLMHDNGATSRANDAKSEEAEKRKKATQEQLALTLLDLLKGLVPEEAEERAGEGVVGPMDAPMMNGNGVAHAPLGKSETNGYREIEKTTSPRLSSETSKKRKRPMATNPGDYSAAATRKRLRRFLQAASRCSDLVAAEARRQDQQDAEELLLFVLDSLHELLRWTPTTPLATGDLDDVRYSAAKTARLVELNRLVEMEAECLQKLKKCVVTEPDTYNRTVAFLSDVRWHRYLKVNASFITEMFTGQIVRGSQCCSCANLTCLHQEFRVLSLTIDPSQATQSVDSCLETQRRLEDLVADNQVFCDGHCKGKTSRRTQVLIQRAPPVLVVQLQRFKQTSWQTSAEKIGTNVQFPIDEPLDLTFNMFLRDAAHPVRYELQAVCAHIGSALDAGHYIAYARDGSGEGSGLSSSPSSAGAPQRSSGWVKFDDDYVTTLDAATLRRETQGTAYLLFYTQIDTKGSPSEKKTHQHTSSSAQGDAKHSIDDNDNI